MKGGSPLDTNCLLRLFLGDDPVRASLVTTLIDSGEHFSVADEAIIESVFVLEKVKKINRETIVQTMNWVIEKDTLSCSRELFIEILPLYKEYHKLSFVDCYLEVLARKTGNKPLLTFDKELAKRLQGAQLLSS